MNSIWFLIIGTVGFLAFWFGPKLWAKTQRASQEADTRLPHERYPRILNWRKGDRFQRRDYSLRGGPDIYGSTAHLLGLTMDGRVFLDDANEKHNWSLDTTCKYYYNVDASNREISEEMKASKGYTQALSEFNKSVQELHLRDESHGVDLPDKYYPKVPVDLYL